MRTLLEAMGQRVLDQRAADRLYYSAEHKAGAQIRKVRTWYTPRPSARLIGEGDRKHFLDDRQE
jgi:hypothetical protein